jgi:hypothetical protein
MWRYSSSLTLWPRPERSASKSISLSSLADSFSPRSCEDAGGVEGDGRSKRRERRGEGGAEQCEGNKEKGGKAGE